MPARSPDCSTCRASKVWVQFHVLIPSLVQSTFEYAEGCHTTGENLVQRGILNPLEDRPIHHRRGHVLYHIDLRISMRFRIVVSGG
ncbi:hypothetical protein BDP81DRAFT_422661 [Colletotrichum phormii]|uniref:Uncharacterized protein n=1 Tax=Colletotrichum phormii TaxID=359342 RepID=A0AAJ0EG05_9PEZI|nr:uncharacterized protein BDP81DRAFT_422661 [Colletotrichum phormii]KAK1638782.1 hypothetical protein BDP81DRAFT_422661 [Colletotrichum phormii]